MRWNTFLSIVIAPAMTGVSLSAGNFQVDRAVSEVAVKAKASPPHSFKSVAQDYEYDIQIDPASLAVSNAVFSFNFSDLDSNSAKRDKKMRSWMDVAVNQSAQFELGRVKVVDGKSVGVGTFSMHGVSKEIDVTFSVTRQGEKLVLDGEAEFSYEDWGLEIVRLFLFTVKPVIQPHFHLEGVLSDR